MTADTVFSRFPEFIREYIYSHGWEKLRETQLEAARVIFGTEDNLLLASSTASGKTEAVFFPILTELSEAPLMEDGVKVLYIAPLKSLINDQFGRMEELLRERRSCFPLAWRRRFLSKNKASQTPRGDFTDHARIAGKHAYQPCKRSSAFVCLASLRCA